MARKTVYFYQMEIFKRIPNISQKDSIQKKYLKRNNILKIYENNILTNNNLINSSLVAKKDPKQQILEVIDFDKEYLFARLGKPKNDTAVQLRNRNSLESAKIEKDQDQDIEIYTYFYLDFKTGIITFINTLSAPRITVLNNLISKYYNKQNIETEIFPILTKDVVDIIKKKEVIGNIQFSVALPSDDILDLEGIGLSRKEFDKIHKNNLKKQEISIKLISSRNRNIFEKLSPDKIADFISNIFNKSKGKVNKCIIKAKDQGETLDDYNILKDKITKKVTVEYNSEHEILNKLQQVYYNKKEELLKYTRPDIPE